MFADGLDPAWPPKVCRAIAFLAGFRDLGLLFYILLGFRCHFIILTIISIITIIATILFTTVTMIIHTFGFMAKGLGHASQAACCLDLEAISTCRRGLFLPWE